MTNIAASATPTSVIEKDVTDKIRYEGYQTALFACIDGMQQNGYGVREVVLDDTKPGGLASEFVAYGDFGMAKDTKNIQEAEMVTRNYYFSKTALLAMVRTEEVVDELTGQTKIVEAADSFSQKQVDLICAKEPSGSISSKDKSLYKIQKLMFRRGGVVQVAWACEETCDDWLRAPRPLFTGRKEAVVNPMTNQPQVDPITGVMSSKDVYETLYPYFLYPYLITENDTINMLKGRAYLDQDTQQATTSLVSSYCTGHRRAAGLYFSKDVSDPNDDIMLQKNIFFKSGAIINSKVSQFQLSPPSGDTLNAVNALITMNKAETSQVNFAAQNRQDSRKTATEVNASMQTQQSLSTVQVVLFSNSLRAEYSYIFGIIQSRVLTGLIVVTPELFAMYQQQYIIKPSGDTDVIERQQLINAMMQAWGVMQNTPAAMAFLSDMLTKMFPESAPRYLQILQQAQEQQQSQQAQQMQQGMAAMQQMAGGIVQLSKQTEMFSDVGKLHALPVLQQAARTIEGMSGGQK